MAQSSPETIFNRKHGFLNSQTRILSKPLAPSRKWRAGNSNAAAADDDGRLSEKAVREALFKANQVIAQHNKRAYAPEALRHIAEQLEALYLREEGGLGSDDGEGDEFLAGGDDLRVGVDLTKPESITKLAPEWPDEDDLTAHPDLSESYAALVTQLRELSSRRQETEKRVARLRRLGELVAPFSSGNGGIAGVQENLATRGSEMESELERMRFLLARVGSGVARPTQEGLGQGEGDGDSESLFREGRSGIGDIANVENQRVEEMLNRF